MCSLGPGYHGSSSATLKTIPRSRRWCRRTSLQPPVVGVQAISHCQQLPARLLPALPRCRIDLYLERSRNPMLAQDINEIVREFYWRGYLIEPFSQSREYAPDG